jgi:hypothetical protein
MTPGRRERRSRHDGVVCPVSEDAEVVTYANTPKQDLRKTAGTDGSSQSLAAWRQDIVHHPGLALLSDLSSAYDSG